MIMREDYRNLAATQLDRNGDVRSRCVDLLFLD
jgi:hypothetical protein